MFPKLILDAFFYVKRTSSCFLFKALKAIFEQNRLFRKVTSDLVHSGFISFQRPTTLRKCTKTLTNRHNFNKTSDVLMVTETTDTVNYFEYNLPLN